MSLTKELIYTEKVQTTFLGLSMLFPFERDRTLICFEHFLDFFLRFFEFFGYYLKIVIKKFAQQLERASLAFLSLYIPYKQKMQ